MKDFILKLLGYSEEYIKFLITKNEQLLTQTLNDANTVSELLNTKTVLTDEVLKLQEENNKLKQCIINSKTKLNNNMLELYELSGKLEILSIDVSKINTDIYELVNSELDIEE